MATLSGDKAQYSSLNDPNGRTEVDGRQRRDTLAAPGIVADFASHTARIVTVAAGHTSFIEDFPENSDPIEHTGGWLTQVVRGYFNYHAVPGNLRRIHTFRRETARHWLFTLRRRSQRSRWTWERFENLIDRYLPEPQILHPYPLDRFYAKYPDKSRVRQQRSTFSAAT